MWHRIKITWRLLFCKQYILFTRNNENYKVTYDCKLKDVRILVNDLIPAVESSIALDKLKEELEIK